MTSPLVSAQKPIAGSGLFTYYPRFRESFPDILRVILAPREWHTYHSGSPTDSGRSQNIAFRLDRLDEFSREWEHQDPGRAIWLFREESPSGLLVLVADNLSGYGTVQVSFQRDYLAIDGKVGEFLMLLRKLYHVLHPMYGNAFVGEMLKKVNPQPRSQPSGIDLRRGIPDIFWANFLGPEYVEMFGEDRVFSAPCYSVERMQDGGALMLLSTSPLDYLADPGGFDKRRRDIKRHLGLEAFNSDEDEHQPRVPKFRYDEDWKAQLENFARFRSPDLLAGVPRKAWDNWVENNQSIALAFISDMKVEGVTLDSTKKSLEDLDMYIEALRKKERKPSIDFIQKMAAYVTQIVINEAGAKWSYPQTDDIPSVKIGGVIITPLARTLKVLEEGEKFGPWYNTISKLMNRVK